MIVRAFAGALTALCVAGLLSAAPAAAQSRAGEERVGGYDRQITDLARILGRAHYLRITCNGRSDARWRTFVRHMIQREPQFRSQIEDGFNEGYLQEEARFPYCDRGAIQMEAELRADGMRLAQALSVRNAVTGVVRQDGDEDDE